MTPRWALKARTWAQLEWLARWWRHSAPAEGVGEVHRRPHLLHLPTWPARVRAQLGGGSATGIHQRGSEREGRRRRGWERPRGVWLQELAPVQGVAVMPGSAVGAIGEAAVRGHHGSEAGRGGAGRTVGLSASTCCWGGEGVACAGWGTVGGEGRGGCGLQGAAPRSLLSILEIFASSTYVIFPIIPLFIYIL